MNALKVTMDFICLVHVNHVVAVLMVLLPVTRYNTPKPYLLLTSSIFWYYSLMVRAVAKKALVVPSVVRVCNIIV